MKILIIMIIILRHLSLLQPDTGIRPDLPPSPQVKKKLNQHFATHKNISLIISPIFLPNMKPWLTLCILRVHSELSGEWIMSKRWRNDKGFRNKS